MKKVGIIGSGEVGKALAKGFLEYGYMVIIGSRSPDKLSEWKSSAGSNAFTGTFNEAAAFGEIIVLAVKGSIAKKALQLVNEENLFRKIVIDATNPIADKMPEEGVLNYFSDINKSLMEELQDLYPQAYFVKAFNSVGSATMVNPKFESKPTMFICGNHKKAKSVTAEIANQFGWEIEDMGTAISARAIEPLAMLWCIPGFRENRWKHAFKLLK